MATQPEVDTPSDVLRFRLRGVDGAYHSLASLAGQTATVVVFLGNGCPTVRAYEDRLMALRNSRRSAGVTVIAINSNNPHLSPPDTYSEMVERASKRKFNFPYLKDDDGEVAKRFGAVCTPHAFLLNSGGRVIYRGRIDDSRTGDTISSRDLENAVADAVAGRPVAVDRTEPFGCSIVW